ncbi:mismatch-specific DNA-glycosylase [Naasia aerilata]
MSRAYLESFRDKTIEPTVGPGLRLLLVGINPGLWTAATGAPFARPGNRFYPALAAAGILDRVIDASEGLRAADRQHLINRGVGITSLVARATSRADELSAEEYRAGAALLTERVTEWRPRVVAILGIGAYRTGFGMPKAVPGRQPVRIADAELWVVPNPSGLNAHESLATLAAAYREPALAAGIALL